MYHFQESHNKRLQCRSQDQQQQNNPQTVFRAKQERFEAINDAEKLKNRVKHLEEQQSKTNIKIQNQNERTIQLLKKKFESEQQRHQKKLRNQDNQRDLEQLKEKVKYQKQQLENNIKANQEKVTIQKQNRHRSVRNEDIKNDLQARDVRSKIYQEKQNKANIVKNIIQQTKLNLENYWDKKADQFEMSRNYSIEEQGVLKSQKEIKLKELSQKEQLLLGQFKNTLSQQDQSTDQLNSIKNMSTKQFKEKYPEFYNKVMNEMVSPKSPRSSKGVYSQVRSTNGPKLNRKLETIYMINQHNQKSKR